MLSIGPSNLDNAQVEFEIHFEERLKTVLNSNPEELQADESKPKKRQKKNLSNEGNEEREKIPSRKKKKTRSRSCFFFDHLLQARQCGQRSTIVHLSMRMMMTISKSVKR